MHRGAGFLSVIATLVLLVSSVALAAPLPTDPNAMVGWKGTQAYLHTPIAGVTLKANVEYAVYAPGFFNLSFPATDPSGGAHYVYAYEIFNDQGGNRSILNFTVGFSGGNELPANIGHTALTLSGTPIAPTSSSFIPAGTPKTSAKWDFSPSTVFPAGTGRKSNILYYTSPYGPEWDNGSLQGSSGTANTQLLPSPAPEPATWILGLTGMAALMLFRFARRPVAA